MSENGGGDRFKKNRGAHKSSSEGQAAILQERCAPGPPPPPTLRNHLLPELDGQQGSLDAEPNALRSGVSTRPLPAVSVCAAAIRAAKARRCSAPIRCKVIFGERQRHRPKLGPSHL